MTPLLLDSHVVIWLLDENPNLGPSARAAIDSAPTAMCSTTSLWELNIKERTGKLRLPAGFTDAVLASGIRELAVSSTHVEAIEPAALSHRDPFDHMLVAQARVEGLRLLTADTTILGAGLPFTVDARE